MSDRMKQEKKENGGKQFKFINLKNKSNNI